MKKMFFSAGKVILFGEHSVIYGHPAIVATLNSKGVTAWVEDQTSGATEPDQKSSYLRHILTIFSNTFGVDALSLSIKTTSTLSQKSGLGSSAAYAHSVLQVVANHFNKKISKEDMYSLVFKAEDYIHVNGSGIDSWAAVYPGVTFFKRGKDASTKQLLQLPKKYSFLMINSGKSAETTGDMVSLVAKEKAKNKDISLHFKEIGAIAVSAKQQLETGLFTGELITQNQRELEALGVVGERARKMIQKIESIGAHAKIIGGGGLQMGSGWLLTYSTNLGELQKLCTSQTWENFIVEVQ